MSDSTRSPVSFDDCDATRTCPTCGDTLKSYDKGAARVLACLNCFFTIANASVPAGGMWLPRLAADREEHARLAAAFRDFDKGGA